MTVDLKTIAIEPKRQTFGHIARRFGADRPATRYEEATLDVQATANFHYKPLWEPEYWHYDVRKTQIVMQDWYSLRDPRQLYYATYNIGRAGWNGACERNFALAEKRNLLGGLDPALRGRIERFLLPLRHAHWGANMNMSEACQRGYGTAVTAPCIFSAGDHLGMAQIVSRIGLLLDGQTGHSLDRAKESWMTDPAWQGVRRLVEDSFVERDWFRLLVEQTLAINSVVFGLIYDRADAAWDSAATTVSLLTEFMADWRDDEGRWVDAVISGAAAESEANKQLISRWAARAIDRAAAAARPLAAALLGDEAAAEAAANDARTRATRLGVTLDA
ncbi:ferritin family protein [Rhodopila globiformis]|uniref:Phenol hydroxylase n=1 Tax=Rhodopila globiformis TaxID=1071 RepID=A0A2S6NGL7_RHOGL|nr:phenol hydroxylase [Rhodopila globiformis]PPQ33747.1 hypothetical protein CCS01_13850 [Rhodopila globiformis]